MEEKETILLCEEGVNISIFHSNSSAKEKYENRSGDHEIIVLNFDEEIEKYGNMIKKI